MGLDDLGRSISQFKDAFKDAVADAGMGTAAEQRNHFAALGFAIGRSSVAFAFGHVGLLVGHCFDAGLSFENTMTAFDLVCGERADVDDQIVVDHAKLIAAMSSLKGGDTILFAEGFLVAALATITLLELAHHDPTIDEEHVLDDIRAAVRYLSGPLFSIAAASGGASAGYSGEIG